MKIVTWNCNGAFRKKYKEIARFDADIYVIQECEDPSESKHIEYLQWAKNFLWTGDNKHKGLGVFAKSHIHLEKLNWQHEFKGHPVKHFLPCRIQQDFNLLAVWTHKNNSPNFGYVGQLWKFIQLNKGLIHKTIIAGDLNSNSIWDQWDRWWNHSDVVQELRDLGIESIYHSLTGEAQGKETTPTFFFRKDQNKTYHIDYLFTPSEITDSTSRLQIGTPNDWLSLSDHMPLVFETGIFRFE